MVNSRPWSPAENFWKVTGRGKVDQPAMSFDGKGDLHWIGSNATREPRWGLLSDSQVFHTWCRFFYAAHRSQVGHLVKKYSQIFLGVNPGYVRETMCLKGMLLPVFWRGLSNSYLFARWLINLRTLCLSWPTCILAQKSPALVYTMSSQISLWPNSQPHPE